MTKTKQKLSPLVSLAKNDQDQPKLSPLVSLAKNDQEKIKAFTVGNLGKTINFSFGNLAENSQDYFFENKWNSHGVSVHVTYQQS